MARQGVIGSSPPGFVNETGTRQGVVGSGGFLDETASGAVAAPVGGHATGVPRGASGSIDLRSWVFSSPIALLTAVQAALPFNQYDWPVPRGAARAPAFALASPQVLTAPAAASPFVQSNWPVPRGAVGSIDLRTFVQGPIPPIVYPASFTFGWPNPRGAEAGVDLRTFAPAAPLALLTTVPGVPFAFTGWVNPRGADPGGVDLRTFAPAVPLTLLTFVQPVPFAFTGWTNPRGADHPVGLRGFAGSFPLSLIGKDAFFGLAGAPNFDWPNPRGAVGSVGLRTWALSTSLCLTVIPPALPCLNFDWPVPRRPVQYGQPAGVNARLVFGNTIVLTANPKYIVGYSKRPVRKLP